MPRFERVKMGAEEWDRALAAFPDRTVFQTSAWLAFLAETQKAELVLAALKTNKETVGYFSGLIFQKFGLRILGSPFRGWSTPYLGFSLAPTATRRMAAEALPDFAFNDLRCHHFEVVDSRMQVEDIAGLGYEHNLHSTLEMDLTQSEEIIFSKMHSVCRRNIRAAEKRGVVIEEAKDAAFAEEYAEQLKDVFAKQGLVPNYGVDRVRALIKHMQPTGQLLQLRARDPEGRCIATGIYPALNQAAFYWGGASWRQYQNLRPNEMLHWSAMRYWKQRGIRIYNMVGTMDFKQKFGGELTTVAMMSQSKYRWLARLRSAAPKIGRSVLHFAWKLKSVVRPKPKAAGGDEE